MNPLFNMMNPQPQNGMMQMMQRFQQFRQAIAGRNPDEIWPIMDEVMTALMALNRRLYDAAMRKLQ